MKVTYVEDKDEISQSFGIPNARKEELKTELNDLMTRYFPDGNLRFCKTSPILRDAATLAQTNEELVWIVHIVSIALAHMQAPLL